MSKSFYPKPTTGSGTTYVTTKAEPEEEDEDEELAVNHGDGPLKSYSKVIYNRVNYQLFVYSGNVFARLKLSLEHIPHL